jgi:hypothetical protein
MTLGELSEAWNALRNAAWGRGSTPTIEDHALANDVAEGWKAWRRYYEKAGFTDDFLPSVAASEWVDRYRALAARMADAGHPQLAAVALPKTPFEQAASAVKWGVGLLVGLSVATLLASLIRGGKSQ